MRRSRLAVVIPTYKHYSDLNDSEKKSLHNTCKKFNQYDLVFVTHENLDMTAYYEELAYARTLKTELFSPIFFAGIDGYNKLLLSPIFYKRFVNYEYILICQLDVYVFADHLQFFIDKSYDYIGAPWFAGYDNIQVGSPIIGVGNGGFSLRKVKSFMSVLYALEVLRGKLLLPKVLQTGLRNWLSVLRIAKHEYDRRSKAYDCALPWKTQVYEDVFWGKLVNSFFPWFKVGTIEDAIAFSFEVNPRELYVLNKHKLPMATHAWEKYDPDFWKEFID
jgi:hypothetical protein